MTPKEPVSLAFAWGHQPHMPGADTLDKNQRAHSLNQLAKELRRRGHDYHPSRVRDLTPTEIARLPYHPAPGIEVHGIYYPLTTPATAGEPALFDMTGDET